MLNPRRNRARPLAWSQAKAPMRRPGAVGGGARPAVRGGVGGSHALTRAEANARLHEYERGVKASFDAIVPTLKRVSALQHEQDFERQAQRIAKDQLGFELPEQVLADAWVDQLDMRRLFAWCVFKAYERFCDDFFGNDPLGEPGEEERFQQALQECGFHTLDISPCADGRLAHVIRYVLRLPFRAVRRKSYAGAMFDIDDSIQKWVETEMLRFREGKPNTADAPTRYLKAVVYHYSSVDPEHEGCAAHGSDTARAAQAGLDRLQAFQQAIQNSFCCGASIDLLLIGLDTDTDAIRVHLPNAAGEIDPTRYVDATDLYDATRYLSADEARDRVLEAVRAANDAPEGMVRLAARLIENNFSQIEYVRNYHGRHYEDIGHAERFIGAGIGFEEVQLRNLTYFAYLDTVEEAAPDLDVGVKIFSKLNVSRGLPIPVVVRYDYHNRVPGARDRAVEHCHRVAEALADRYEDLTRQGLLHTLLVVRDCKPDGRIEVLGSSVEAQGNLEAH